MPPESPTNAIRGVLGYLSPLQLAGKNTGVYPGPGLGLDRQKLEENDLTEQGQDNGAHFNEGRGGGAFAEKATMGLAFEMAAVVLNSACASSSFSDMLLVGCFHYHVLPTRPEPPAPHSNVAPG